MTYLLTYYQNYHQFGKTFDTLKELSDFAIDLESRENGFCTTYKDNNTNKQISGKVFRNWLNKLHSQWLDKICGW